MKAIVGCIFVAGCVSSNVVTCPDGRTCPEDTECRSITYGAGDSTRVEPVCATHAQIDACTNGTCDGTCHDGLCLDSVCGNDLVDNGELCDLGEANGHTDIAERCSLDCTSLMVCGNSLIDVSMGESCDNGAFASHDGCSSTCDAEQPQWYRLLQRPFDRANMQIVYDAHRRRTVLFGGSVTGLNANLSGTWEWDGATWTSVPTIVEPPSRSGHAMTYDAVRRRVVLFSGSNDTNDTWTYDGQWRAEEAPGERPAARTGASFAFDTKRGVAVLFGGQNRTTTPVEYLADTWEWDGTSWKRMSPAMSPPPRLTAAAAYDPKRGVVVLFGGVVFFSVSPFTQYFHDTWEYDGTTWTQKQITGPDKYAGAMSWDPVSQRILLSGGQSETLVDGVFTRKDTWAYDGQSWTKIDSADNAEVVTTVAATDGVRGVAQLFSSGLHKMLEWNGTAWVQPAGDVAAGTPGPLLAMYQGVVAMKTQLLAFGGADKDPFVAGTPTISASTQLFDGNWRLLGGTEPSARFLPAMAYDAKRDQVVMFSGCTYGGSGPDAIDDGGTWIFAAGAWTKNTGTAPPPACGASMAYDSARDQIILFGGAHLSGGVPSYHQDTWAWNGTGWVPLSPTMHPSTGWRGVMAEDPIHQQLVYYTGVRKNDGFSDIPGGETWVWNGADWSRPADAGSPTGRYSPAMAWNPARRRLMFIGGAFRSIAMMSPDPLVAERDGTRWNVVPAAGSEAARYAGAGAAWRDGAVILGGGNGASTLRELLLVRHDAGAPAETCAGADTDGDGLAGCADPDCWYACTPTCMPGVTCTDPPLLCGNSTCDASETCASCEADCGACPATCGNYACDGGESSASCPGDCP